MLLGAEHVIAYGAFTLHARPSHIYIYIQGYMRTSSANVTHVLRSAELQGREFHL
jgi:hypothetical protein